MVPLVALAILALLSVPLVVAIRRSNELFCLDVRDGVADVRRGRLPQGLLDDINDVVAKPAVPRALLRVVREEGRPRVLVRGAMNDGQLQQLRNVVGRYEVASIRAGGRGRR